MSADRAPVVHRVKSWPQFFAPSVSGEKSFDVRRSTDRDYRVGDTLLLQEYDPETGLYSGREAKMAVTYLISEAQQCALSGSALNPGYVIMGIRPA